MRGMTRAAVAAMAAVLLATTGCGGSDEGDAGAGGATGSTTTADEITVAVSSSPSADALRRVAPAFEAETGVRVRFVDLPYQQLAAKVLLAARQQGDGYDVIQFDSPMLAPLAAGGALADIGERVDSSAAYAAEDFPEQVRDYATYDDTTYAVPLSTEPYVLWYNTALFDELGLRAPATWDEYAANARRLDAAGHYGSDSGFGSEIGAYYWLETIYAHGGRLLDEQSCTATLDTPEVRAATELYLDMLPFTPATAVNGGGNEMTTAFTQGDVGQEINATGYYSIMADPRQSRVAGRFEAAVPPGPTADKRATLLFGWLIGVGSRSDAQDTAWQFLEFALGREGVARLVAEGAPPPARTSLRENRALVRELPYFPTLIEAAEVGTHLPYIPAMPEIITALSAELSKAATGGGDAAQLVETAQSQVADILSDSGCE